MSILIPILVLVDLRLARSENVDEACVIGVVRIINNRVDQVRCRDGGIVREVSSVSDEQCDSIGPILHRIVRKNESDIIDSRVAQHKVAIRIGGLSVQIKCLIGLII